MVLYDSSCCLIQVAEEAEIGDVKSIIDLEYTSTYKEMKNGILINMQDYCFAAEIDGIRDLNLSNEHEEFKWCSYIEAKEYLK